jgi:hypothetical protein
MTRIKREPWHEALLESPADLADVQAQEQQWVRSDPPVWPSPDELRCQLFDDTGIDVLLERGSAISPEVDALLRELDRVTDDVDTEQSPEQLLRDEQWLTAARLADRTLAAVRAALED